jgi:hypothetical protein
MKELLDVVGIEPRLFRGHFPQLIVVPQQLVGASD